MAIMKRGREVVAAIEAIVCNQIQQKIFDSWVNCYSTRRHTHTDTTTFSQSVHTCMHSFVHIYIRQSEGVAREDADVSTLQFLLRKTARRSLAFASESDGTT